MLYLEKISLLDDYYELGGDYINGKMMLEKIADQFDVRIAQRDFMHDPTLYGLDQLLSYLLEE